MTYISSAMKVLEERLVEYTNEEERVRDYELTLNSIYSLTENSSYIYKKYDEFEVLIDNMLNEANYDKSVGKKVRSNYHLFDDA
ncbi:hypothetical protein RZ760_010485 [Providencia rettgeri]|nr:hypothetical protein [Providencia rettgeri]